MADIWTIQKLLNWITDYLTQKKVDSPRLSAELLLSDILGMKRIELYMHFDKAVEQVKLDTLRGLVKRAGEHEPIGYLVGRTEFYSLELNVCRDCLIPRPETELLVERAIEFLRTRTGTQYVLDLCTGCGCIAIAIAKNYPDVKVIATDISDAALSVAAKNIEKHKLADKITLLSGDLFEPIIRQLDAPAFDLIVSNPPYVSEPEFEKLDKNVKDYEPHLALQGGFDGLAVYRRVTDQVNNFLKLDGALMMEIGYAQGSAIRHMLEATALFASITIEKDLSNNDRIAIAKKSEQPNNLTRGVEFDAKN
jgi:release factor glutamine methyltransferase